MKFEVKRTLRNWFKAKLSFLTVNFINKLIYGLKVWIKAAISWKALSKLWLIKTSYWKRISSKVNRWRSLWFWDWSKTFQTKSFKEKQILEVFNTNTWKIVWRSRAEPKERAYDLVIDWFNGQIVSKWNEKLIRERGRKHWCKRISKISIDSWKY